MKGELKFVSTEFGELSAPQLTATIMQIGTLMMPKLSVVSWDTKNLVQSFVHAGTVLLPHRHVQGVK